MIPGGSNKKRLDTRNCYICKLAQYLASRGALLHAFMYTLVLWLERALASQTQTMKQYIWGSLSKLLATSSYHKDGDTYRTSATNGSTLQWTAVIKATRMTTQNPECYQIVATRNWVSKALLGAKRWVAGTCSDSPTFEPCMVTYLQVSSRTYATVQETDCSQTEKCCRAWSK